MPKSPHFIRIQADVLKLVAAIPAGRVTSFASIGAHLDVMARHVAYILSTLPDEQKLQLPWYRVVGEGGALGTLKRGFNGQPQEAFLQDEGVVVNDARCVLAFERHFIDAGKLRSGVPKQTRPEVLDPPAQKRPARPRKRIRV